VRFFRHVDNLPELSSQQHKQVRLFWIWDTELAANLACEEIGDFYMSWNRGNAAWIGQIDVLLCFDPFSASAHPSIPNAG
jgi:hypothetical protein